MRQILVTVALFNVDNTWGPAVTLNSDGTVYLPNSNVTTSGNGASSVSGCAKFIASTFRTNGSVNLCKHRAHGMLEPQGRCLPDGLAQTKGEVMGFGDYNTWKLRGLTRQCTFFDECEDYPEDDGCTASNNVGWLEYDPFNRIDVLLPAPSAAPR